MADSTGKIHIKRTQLLEAIKSNAEKHVKELADARAAFAKKIIEMYAPISGRTTDDDFAWAKSIAKTASKLSMIRPPQDCSKHYADLIRRFELDVRECIELTEQEFNHWILDQANWRTQARMLNTSYIPSLVDETDD